MNPDKKDAISEKDIERMAREVGTPLPPGFLQEILAKAKEIDIQKAKSPSKGKATEKDIGDND